MNKTIHQQVIDFIDEKDGATYAQISRRFDCWDLAMNALEDLLADGQIRQISTNPLMAEYKFVLA